MHVHEDSPMSAFISNELLTTNFQLVKVHVVFVEDKCCTQPVLHSILYLDKHLQNAFGIY
jgi:hypothetical protein